MFSSRLVEDCVCQDLRNFGRLDVFEWCSELAESCCYISAAPAGPVLHHLGGLITTIINTIITWKGASRDFYNLLTAPWTVFNMYAQVAKVQSCATHWVLIMCNMLCAMWYEGTAQLLSLTELKSHFFLTFILLTETITRWRRGRNYGTRRKSLTMSFRKCHILKLKNSSPNWDLNLHSSIGGRLGKQTC